jgi:hypothetical protein
MKTQEAFKNTGVDLCQDDGPFLLNANHVATLAASLNHNNYYEKMKKSAMDRLIYHFCLVERTPTNHKPTLYHGVFDCRNVVLFFDGLD